MNTTQLLAEHVWSHPDSYFGFSPDGDYLILSQHRDSDSLTRSNWQVAGQALHAEAYDGGSEEAESRPPVYHWRASHCMVGWVEYLMVRRDAPAAILEQAADILARLENYPALDEDTWSELEFSEACDYWERMSVSDRLDYCQRAGISPFAARRSALPEDPNGSLLESLRG